MMQHPTTLGELLGRFLPEPPADAYRLAPAVGSAVEMDANDRESSGRFWVIVHSVTDAGLTLVHQRPLRSKTLSVRLEAGGGEVVRVLLAVGPSQSAGELLETCAQFQHVGFDVGQLS